VQRLFHTYEYAICVWQFRMALREAYRTLCEKAAMPA
jgi:hypothetical protein